MSKSQEIMQTSEEVVMVVDEEDYIDMELISSPRERRFQCHSSPPQTREFEFQMISPSAFQDKEAAATTTSPADELFYKGKLLPLHLPPRLQMVENLLQISSTTTSTSTITSTNEDKSSIISQGTSCFDEKCGSIIPSFTNISPSESCRVSCEINPDECFFEWSTEMNSFIRNHPKRSWARKLKRSSLGQKLKASSVYIKSLFTKSGCTSEPFCVKAAPSLEDDSPKGKYLKVTSNIGLFGKDDHRERHKFNTLSKSIEREMAEEGYISQRRSFSGVIQWHSSSKSLSPSSVSTSSSGSSSSSSSFSFSSNNGFHDLNFLKRSGSDLEGSIEGAIAHCKMSHHQLVISSRKTSSSEVTRPGCSLSAPGIKAPEDLDRPKIVNLL